MESAFLVDFREVMSGNGDRPAQGELERLRNLLERDPFAFPVDGRFPSGRIRAADLKLGERHGAVRILYDVDDATDAPAVDLLACDPADASPAAALRPQNAPRVLSAPPFADR